jgi:photosystem II stability/assembly factor-like uncharacterized protein
VAFDPRNPQTVYVLALGVRGGRARGYVFKTTDGGAHWHATATSGSGWIGTNEALTADPRHPGTLYAGTQVAVYKTVDGGRSWRPSNRGLPTPPRGDRAKGWVIDLGVDPAHTNVVYAGSDRVSKSSDGGRSWKTVFAPEPTRYRATISALAIAPTRPEAIYAIAADYATDRTSIFQSTDAGETWHAAAVVRGVQGSGYGFVTALAVDPRHPTTVYAALGANVLKTTDAGKTWQPIAHGLPVAANLPGGGGCHCRGGVTSLAVDPKRPGTVFAAFSQGGIDETANGGRTWINVAYHPSYMYAVADDPARPATIYAVGDAAAGLDPWPARISRSTDGGRTWATAP